MARFRRCKALVPLLVFVLSFALVTFKEASKPPPAQAGPLGLPTPSFLDPCNLLPAGKARTLCKAGEDPFGAVPGAIGRIPGVPNPANIVQTVAEKTVGEVLRGFATAEAGTVLWFLKKEFEAINQKTTPDPTLPWFTNQYVKLFGLAFMFGLLVLLFTVVDASRREEFGVAVTGMVRFAVFVLVAGSLPGVVGILTELCDKHIAPAWMAQSGTDVSRMLDLLNNNLTNNISSLDAVGAILAPIAMLAFGIVGGLIFLIEIVVRDFLLYVLTALAVFPMAGAISDRNEEALIRWARTLGATIAFKVIFAVILTISIGVMLQHKGQDAFIIGAFGTLAAPFLSVWVWRKLAGHNPSFRGLFILMQRTRMSRSSSVAARSAA